MGPVGCTETSVRNYNYSLRNISEERSYQLTLNNARWLFSMVDEGNKGTAGRAGAPLFEALIRIHLWFANLPRKICWL